MFQFVLRREYRGWWPGVWVAAVSLALIQPVLALLQNNPLLVTGPGGRKAAWFVVVGLVIGIPAALVLLDWLAGRIHRYVQLVLRTVGLIPLFTLVAGRIVTESGLGGRTLSLGLGAVIGVGGFVIFVMSRQVRKFGSLMAVAALIAVGLLAFSDTGEFLRNGPPKADASTETGADHPPVVFLIVDELPTRTIVTADGQIDTARFPNLGNFAADSTWYRHFTTVAPFTQQAVPSMMVGTEPIKEQAFWINHPDSLFTLLAPDYRMVVGESVTKLCGLNECQPWPVPVPPLEEDVVEIEPLVETDSNRETIETLTRNLSDLWWEGYDPKESDRTPLDDFVEEVTIVGEDGQPIGVFPEGNLEFNEEGVNLARFFTVQASAQPVRFTDFLDSIGPTAEPSMYFLHLVLPHHPFLFDENGLPYETAVGDADPHTVVNETNQIARIAERRHIQQAQYVDGLVGEVMDRLRAEGLYDDALIVLVSDHGMEFVRGEHHREYSADSLAGIAYAPLLIKTPGQTEGLVDDANVLAYDLAPTVAELAGYRIGWDIDGLAIGDEAMAERGDQKPFYVYRDAFDPELERVITFSDNQEFTTMLDLVGRSDGEAVADDVVATIGQPFAPAETATNTTATVANLAAAEGRRSEPLGVLSGWVEGDPIGRTAVVAINDVVVGVSPIERFRSFPRYFVIDLLPLSEAGVGTVRVGIVGTDGVLREVPVEAG